jgi:hypothetical protein
VVNRLFQFQKCGQYFIGTYDETLSVAMRVNNSGGLPLGIICAGGPILSTGNMVSLIRK